MANVPPSESLNYLHSTRSTLTLRVDWRRGGLGDMAEHIQAFPCAMMPSSLTKDHKVCGWYSLLFLGCCFFLRVGFFFFFCTQFTAEQDHIRCDVK